MSPVGARALVWRYSKPAQAIAHGNSGNRGSYFAGEPALATVLIQGGYDVEVSAATGHQMIFIQWTRDSGGKFHKLPAGSRAPIHVVANDRDSRNNWGHFPSERNSVGLGFLTGREPEAKQSNYRQREPKWGGSH